MLGTDTVSLDYRLELAPSSLMSVVSAARAHNAAQPAGRLPTEIVRNIFDELGSESHADRAKCLLPNLPEATAVFSHWRNIALDYSRLWETLHIIAEQPSCIHCITLPPSPAKLHRLDQWAKRAQRHLEVFFLFRLCELSDMCGLEQFLPRIYGLSERIAYLRIDLPSIPPPDAPYSLFPLPRALTSLTHLKVDVRDRQKGDSGNRLQLLQEGVQIRPISFSLGLGGGVDAMLSLIDLSRLEHIRLQCYHTADFTTLLSLLRHTPELRVLTIDSPRPNALSSEPPAAIEERAAETGTLCAFSPLLEFLSIDQNWSIFKNVINPAGIQHLMITRQRERGRPDRITETIQTFRSVKSLVFLDGQIPEGWWTDFWHYEDGTCRHLVHSWLAGKTSLVVLKIPWHFLVHACADAFAPAELPALRYLILSDNRERWTEQDRQFIQIHWSIAEEETRAIRRVNPQVNVTWHRATFPPDGEHWSSPRSYPLPQDPLDWFHEHVLMGVVALHEAGNMNALVRHGLVDETERDRVQLTEPAVGRGDLPTCSYEFTNNLWL